MGFFDDIGGFLGEVKSISNDLTDLKNDVVSEIATGAEEVSTTINDTASELHSSANEIGTTLKDTTSFPGTVFDGDNNQNT